MHRCGLLSALILCAGPAFAQSQAFFQELWLSRNTVMDRAGQCLNSPLGQAVFDNSDCVDGDIRLTPLDTELVRVAQAIEQWADCAVDTDADRLMVEALPFHARLMELFTIPVRIDGEFGCFGYTGPTVPLHAGISNNMTVIGTLEPGQNVTFSHLGLRGGWEYYEVTDAEGAPLAHGWAQVWPSDQTPICDFSAG